MERYHWLSAAESHAGKVRELNEDAILNRPDAGIWAVADGMGGHSAGEVASKSIVSALARVPAHSSLDDLVLDVCQRLEGCNAELFAWARAGGVQIIGSTVVALLSVGPLGACIWAGDSRAYRFRNGQLTQLTEDHSRVQELVSRGTLSADKARHHPQGNVVTRAVGAAEGIELATISFPVEPRDAFLLCSDGLSGELTDSEIEALLAVGDCQHSADALIDATLAKSARDNVSVVVAQAFDNTPTQFRPDAAKPDDETTDRTIIR